MGVDLGERRIGLAVSDPAGSVAVPLTTIERSGDRGSDHEAVLAEARAAGAEVVVVGLPLTMEGEVGTAARKVLSEVDALRRLADPGTRIETQDERLTTVTADRRLAETGAGGRRRRQHVDESAAAVILQAYLDRVQGTGAR
ncbi:MAG TPA: Holliday junction resolvase RuvX [Acidimicrobiia bacterium]|nr:Holliday junction resolvase RuvX [Acidimicrobiia bacterium]